MSHSLCREACCSDAPATWDRRHIRAARTGFHWKSWLSIHVFMHQTPRAIFSEDIRQNHVKNIIMILREGHHQRFWKLLTAARNTKAPHYRDIEVEVEDNQLENIYQVILPYSIAVLFITHSSAMQYSLVENARRNGARNSSWKVPWIMQAIMTNETCRTGPESVHEPARQNK